MLLSRLMRSRFSVHSLRDRYLAREPIVTIALYESRHANIAARAGCDILLVGDSVANCVYDIEIQSVNLDTIGLHGRAVKNGLKKSEYKPMIVCDMPFGSYFPSNALENACRLVQMSGCDAIKLEGGKRIEPIVRDLVDAGFVTFGHIGLTPQTATQLGGMRFQGRSPEEVLDLLEDAKCLERAGVSAIILECLSAEAAELVSESVGIPTIGIGAGLSCSGQVLVSYDMLGLSKRIPSFSKVFCQLDDEIFRAYRSYVEDVKSKKFPGESNLRRCPDLIESPKLASFFKDRKPVENISRKFFDHREEVEKIRKSETYIPHFVKVEEVLKFRKLVKNRILGCVPTMGMFHEGHLELIRTACRECDFVVITRFVNPTQFSENEDFSSYPAHEALDRDFSILKSLQEEMSKENYRGVISLCFQPEENEIYNEKSMKIRLVPEMENASEDRCRPHFFTGVATICLKLFNLIQPQKVFFGQKDAVQCSVIEQMRKQFFLDFDLVVCPTVREKSGLAMSSRNVYIPKNMYATTEKIFEFLEKAKKEKTVGTIRSKLRESLEKLDFLENIEYVAVAERETGFELSDDAVAEKGLILSTAVRFSDGNKSVRLLDCVNL